MEKKKISLKEIGLPKLVMLFMAGILLILLSFPNMFGSKESKKETPQNNNQPAQNDTNMTSYDSNTYIAEMESKLEGILRKVSGVGEVKVMITLKSSKEQVPLKDRPFTQEGVNEVDREGGSRINNSVQREESTILVANENGNEEPYIIKEIEPEVEGVCIIAEGADDAKVIMDIMDAAEVLFDVPAHKVKVMKMKNEIN
ncbi:MAG: stage III sporulation protein AG [Lachnospiraceae bacterium]|jgi:stage III sporulation protein AG|nr:stage III sporulation protein AG [Lachnospiraceae bacterium]